MRHGMLLFALLLCVPAESAAQGAACPQALATLSVPPSTYAEVKAEPFARRVFVYVPPFKGKGFQPFQLWVVEGVYGRPFVQSSGVLDEANFAKLRASTNVSATPVSVSRGNGTDVGRFVVSRVPYQLQVLRVSDSVQVRVCR